jgi:hypothetical protein
MSLVMILKYTFLQFGLYSSSVKRLSKSIKNRSVSFLVKEREINLFIGSGAPDIALDESVAGS